jgi:hypothetical protein
MNPVQGTTGSITSDPAGVSCQLGAVQPLYIANSTQRNHCYIDVKHVTIRKSIMSKPSILITLKYHDRDVATQINAILTLPMGKNSTSCLAQST